MSIGSDQRRRVRERAGNCCEYCRIAQTGRLARVHVDHVVAVKHGGGDTEDNRCLACPKCNGYKGSNIAGLDPQTGSTARLFNPRQQRWEDHFKINPDATVAGLTPEGRATVIVLRINDEERVQHRLSELAVGDYPCTNE